MRPVSAYVLEPGSAELRWMGATSSSFVATGELTGGKFAMIDERAPRGVGAPLHAHADDDESFYVVEGEVTFYVGEAPPRRGGLGHSCTCPAASFMGFGLNPKPPGI